MSAEPTPVSASSTIERAAIVIRGAVQGVGFRPFVYRLATELDLRGWVTNSAAGVFIEVEGPSPRVREFVVRVECERPAIAYIQSLEATFLDPCGFTTFEIRESSGGEKTALILPDLATCPDCLREISDPADRRHRYPFTNCTNCGPRYSIIEALPYDRPRTAMKMFRMCAACEQEYRDPTNRRFHAQPNACPDCGPQLTLWDAGGATLATRDAALAAAVEAVRAGRIVAVKGLGGFHLICDARHDTAIGDLRRRKRREEKPFALLYPSLAEVERDCEVSDIERRLLLSPECPIVLLRRRAEAANALSPLLAPGNPNLGVMLPYTPLHHLFMRDLGFPVVATSGNLSDEPICTDENEALARLRGIADLFLVHNRPIVRHVDDSIVREMAGRELVLRRARGFAPLPALLPAKLPPAIAVGAHQKNTVAAAVGNQAFVSQHLGDLDSLPSMNAFTSVIDSFRTLYELTPQTVACDLHPDYASTRWATQSGFPTFAVQHHYAHALACMAENRLEAPALAVTWDGSGYGPDSTVWGGEFLRITADGFERLGHVRTFRLPGGEAAVKQPRRVALALLHAVFGDAVSELDSPTLGAFTADELRVLRTMLARGVNSPVTSSAGRLFDAVASLCGLRHLCAFEGQAAMELEFSADGASRTRAYELPVTGDRAPYILDWEPLVRTVVADVIAAHARASIACAFHLALSRAIVEIATRIGEARVLLTGGCFQNRLLTESAVAALTAAGFRPYWHQRVPPNDGCISLGQLVALARDEKSPH